MKVRSGLVSIAALAFAGAALFTACQDGALPTAPREGRSEGAEVSEGATADRMPIAAVRRGRQTLNRTTAGATPVPPTPTPGVGPPTMTPTPPPPTATPSPTRTPTPAGPTLIRLRGVRWAWQWIAGPGTTPANPSTSITLRSGQTYSLHVFNGDIYDDAYQPHFFSGVFGLISGAQLPYGAPDVVLTFTAPVVTQSTTYGFSCVEFYCGPVTRHEGMLGTIVVIP